MGAQRLGESSHELLGKAPVAENLVAPSASDVNARGARCAIQRAQALEAAPAIRGPSSDAEQFAQLAVKVPILRWLSLD